MLGDTPYDVEAALRAGIAIVGVECGGWGAGRSARRGGSPSRRRRDLRALRRVPVRAVDHSGRSQPAVTARARCHLTYFLNTASRVAGRAVRSRAQRSGIDAKRCGAVAIVKSRGSNGVVELLPRERRRDAGELAGARAVGGRQRLAENVLQVVHVDRAARPRAHGALDRRGLRMPRGDHASRRSGRTACPIRTTCPAAAECRCAGRSIPTSSARPARAATPARRAPSAPRRARARTACRRRDRDRAPRSRRRAATAPARTTGPARSRRSASCRAA